MKKVVNTAVKKVEKKSTKVNAYKANVLGVNKDFKTTQKSLGGCVRMLLNFAPDIKLNPAYKRKLTAVKKDSKEFKEFSDLVRFNKDKNTTSPFYVLQALYKLDKAGELK